MINGVLCTFRRMLYLLTPVLSPIGSFCSVIPILHDYSLCNLLATTILRLTGRDCRRLGHSLSSVSLGTRDCDVRPHTTGSEEAACSELRCAKRSQM
jgi:hypothetical protein